MMRPARVQPFSVLQHTSISSGNDVRIVYSENQHATDAMSSTRASSVAAEGMLLRPMFDRKVSKCDDI